jgi:hypothetical protein
MTQTDIPVNNNDTISLKTLILKGRWGWKYLLSKWWIVVIAGTVGAALGLTYSVMKKPVYNATLSFALEDDHRSGGLSGALGLASQFGLDLSGGGEGAFSGDNLLQLMKSRLIVQNTLLTQVVVKGRKQTLAELYISFNNLREKWASKPSLKNIHFYPGADPNSFNLQQDSVLGEFYKILVKRNLTVDKVDKKLSIITISVSSEDEMFSKLFTEVLANTVSDFYKNIKTKKSARNVVILQSQADSVRRQLNLAIAGVASSVDYNPNPNPALQILKVPSQKRQVDIQANTAILSELVKNLEISKMSLLQETPLIQVIDKPILPLDKERFSKLKGIILGGILFGVLAIFFIVANKIYQQKVRQLYE